MDPLTILSLAAAGAKGIAEIANALQALHDQRPTAEQIALLAEIRDRNQSEAERTIARLKAIEDADPEPPLGIIGNG